MHYASAAAAKESSPFTGSLGIAMLCRASDDTLMPKTSALNCRGRGVLCSWCAGAQLCWAALLLSPYHMVARCPSGMAYSSLTHVDLISTSLICCRMLMHSAAEFILSQSNCYQPEFNCKPVEPQLHACLSIAIAVVYSMAPSRLATDSLLSAGMCCPF
jgi:hypothetical protein